METSPLNRLPEAHSLPDGFVESSTEPPRSDGTNPERENEEPKDYKETEELSQPQDGVLIGLSPDESRAGCQSSQKGPVLIFTLQEMSQKPFFSGKPLLFCFVLMLLHGYKHLIQRNAGMKLKTCQNGILGLIIFFTKEVGIRSRSHVHLTFKVKLL